MFKRLTAIIFILTLLFSCKKDDILARVILPYESAMNDVWRFALIVDPYVSLCDKPGENSIIVSYARKLDIFPVEGIEITKNADSRIIWINLGKGWVEKKSVQLYSSKEKVTAAAKTLK